MIESIFSISDGQFWSTFFNLNISSLWNIQWTKRSFFNNVLGESPIWHTNACGNFPKIVGILEKKAEISPSMVQSADLLKRGMKFSKICSMIWMLNWCHFQSRISIIDSFHWQWHDQHDGSWWWLGKLFFSEFLQNWSGSGLFGANDLFIFKKGKVVTAELFLSNSLNLMSVTCLHASPSRFPARNPGRV